MQQNQVQFILAAVDQATAVLKGVEAQIKGLDTTAGAAGRNGLNTFNSQANAINSTLTAIVGGAAFQRFTSFIRDTAVESNQATVDMGLFERQLERNNISITEGTEVLNSLASRLKVLPETLSGNVTQLLRQGLAMEEIAELYTAGAASALAAGKTTSIGIEAVTQAIVNQSSIYLNQAGIAENVVQFLNAEAKARGVVRDELTKEQTARAIVNGILGVTSEEVSDLDRMLGGLAGTQSDLNNATQLLRIELGEMFLPAVQFVTNALTTALNVVRSIPEPITIAVTVFAALTAAAVAITGAIGALSVAVAGLGISLAAVFGPAAIVAGAIGLLVAFATHMDNVQVSTDEASDSFDQAVKSAEPMNEALHNLTTATSKDGLQGAIEALANTLDTTGKTSMLNWASDTLPAILAQGTLQDAILASIEKFSELEQAANASQLSTVHAQQNKVLADQVEIRKALTTAQNNQKAAEAAGRVGEAAQWAEEVKALGDELNKNVANASALNSALVTLNPAQSALVTLLNKSQSGAYDAATAVEELEKIIGGRLTESTENANDNQDDLNNNLNRTGRTARTLRDVFDDLAESGTNADRKMLALGSTAEAQLENAQSKARLFGQALDDAIAMGASQGEIDYLVRKLGEVQARLAELQRQGTAVNILEGAEPILKLLDPRPNETYVVPIQLQIESVTTAEETAAQVAAIKADTLAAMQESGIWHITDTRPADEYVFPIQLQVESLTTQAEIDAQVAAIKADTLAAMRENGIWQIDDPLPDEVYVFPIQLQVESLTTQAELDAQMALIKADTLAAMQESGIWRITDPLPDEVYVFPVQLQIQSVTTLDELKAEAARIAADTEQAMRDAGEYRPVPMPEVTAEGFAPLLGYNEAAVNAFNQVLEQSNALLGISDSKYQKQIDTILRFIGTSEDLTDAQRDLLLQRVGELQSLEATEKHYASIMGAMQGVITISRAVGNAFGGEVGKMAKAIEETAQVAMNAVKAIASGDPVAMAAAAIEAIGFIAREIVEATTDYIKQAAEEIAERYELLSEESANAIVNANKKIETRFFLFIPYRVEVPNQPAVDAAVKMANSFAEGLKSHLASSDAEWSKFVTDWVNDRILTIAVQAQAIGEITNMVNDALADGTITDAEWAAIFDKANIARENAIRDAERRGYRAPAVDPTTAGVPDEVSLGTVSHSIQLAIATPLMNAMDTLHSSVLIFDRASQRIYRASDKFERGADKIAKMPPPAQPTGSGNMQAFR